MERLTKKVKGWKDYCLVCENKCIDGNLDCYYCANLQRMVNKLADYEDAEEQGLLVRLPCKVGDTVYALIPTPLHDSKMIVEGKVGRFSNLGGGLSASVIYYNDTGIVGSMFGYFGDNIFATREEAEAALAKEG